MPWVNIGLIDSPCRKCTDRYISCHGKCDKYRKYKKDLEEVRKGVRKSEGKTRRVFG